MDGLYGINEYIESSFLLLISRQVVVISPNSKGMQSLIAHSGGIDEDKHIGCGWI